MHLFGFQIFLNQEHWMFLYYPGFINKLNHKLKKVLDIWLWVLTNNLKTYNNKVSQIKLETIIIKWIKWIKRNNEYMWIIKLSILYIFKIKYVQIYLQIIIIVVFKIPLLMFFSFFFFLKFIFPFERFLNFCLKFI